MSNQTEKVGDKSLPLTDESTSKVPKQRIAPKKRMAIPDRFLSQIESQAQREQLEPYYILLKWLEAAEKQFAIAQ